MSASPKPQLPPAQSQAALAAEAAAFQKHKWIVAMAVMLGTILETLDTTIVNVALPHMQGSFSASIDEITWVVTSYLVANGIMIPMTGWISARFGRKRYFLISVTGFVLASAACGAARTLDQIVLFRLLQGLAGAAMQPSSQAILMETFPPEEQAMAMAFWGIGMMAAPIMGPTIGGWITDNWSWRWNFYVNVPVGAAAIVMVSTFLHDPPYLRKSRTQRGRVDYPGIALIALTLGALELVLDRGQRADWFASAWVIYTTAIAVASLVLLIARELTFQDPILDLRMLKIPTFTLAIALQVMMSFTLFGVNLMNPVFLQEFMGYTAWQAGIVLAPRGIGAMMAMLMMGQLERYRINTRPLMAVGYLLQLASLWYMAHWTLQIGYWQIVWAPIMMSSGFALFFPPLSAATLSCIERERMGYAASLFGMIRNTGAAVGISVMSTMLVNHQQIHQSYLGEHLSVFDAWQLGIAPHRMPGSPGFLSLPQQLAGHKEGLTMIYRQIQLQSAMLSLNDIYWMLIAFSGTVIPLLLGLWLWQNSKAVRPQIAGAASLAH